MKKSFQEKPWGSFEQFTHSEPTTVKILTINPSQSLSLQYHHNRDEFWKVILGHARITIGDAVHDALDGDEFFIASGQKHRAEAGSSEIKILEISFGDFNENDIVRLEDIYDRTNNEK